MLQIVIGILGVLVGVFLIKRGKDQNSADEAALKTQLETQNKLLSLNNQNLTSQAQDQQKIEQELKAPEETHSVPDNLAFLNKPDNK